MTEATGLVRYDAMCAAIAEAFAVDEVKDIRDQAIAMERYAQQARNTEAEWKACEIRLRAERKCGLLLRDRDMAKGTRGQLAGGSVVRPPAEASPLADLGISKTQSSRWQKLAAIPEADFEATFAQSGRKPSTAGLLAAHQTVTAKAPPIVDVEPTPPTKQVDQRALWLWGRMLDFEREGILLAEPNALIDTMLDHMREATLELAPAVSAWLRRIRT